MAWGDLQRVSSSLEGDLFPLMPFSCENPAALGWAGGRAAKSPRRFRQAATASPVVFLALLINALHNS